MASTGLIHRIRALLGHASDGDVVVYDAASDTLKFATGGGGGSQSQTVTVETDPDTFLAPEQVFDLGPGAHVVQVVLTALALDGDGETFGNDAGTIYAGPDSTGTHLATSYDGVVYTGATAPLALVPIGPQVTPEPSPTLEIQGEDSVAAAVGVCGRYLRIPLAIVSNDDGAIYAGANNPTAQVQIDVEYV